MVQTRGHDTNMPLQFIFSFALFVFSLFPFLFHLYPRLLYCDSDNR
jgi:hypothetical protein